MFEPESSLLILRAFRYSSICLRCIGVGIRSRQDAIRIANRANAEKAERYGLPWGESPASVGRREVVNLWLCAF
jgi:hypothetical protein